MENVNTIRKRIGDEPKTDIERYLGNGIETGFDIHGKNAFDFEITMNDEVVPAEAYAYDSDINKLLFVTPPENEAILVVKYKTAAFTDAELTAIINASASDVDLATAEALRQALGSQSRMVSFQHGDRSVSMSDIFKNLMSLLNSYEKKSSNSGANSGSSVTSGVRTLDDGKSKAYQPDDLSRLMGF